jgi:capsular polysaccharide biosynthesis protein
MRSRARSFRSVRRRAWTRRYLAVVVVATVICTAAGFFVGRLEHRSYVSEAVLVVQSGASKAGPGGAASAGDLAANYAGLIPEDQALQRQVAAVTGLTTSQVQRDLSVTVVTDTALLDVKMSAPTAADAVSGLKTAVFGITGTPSITSAIPTGSVAVVQLPGTATESGSPLKKSVPIGLVLGLVLGIVLGIAWDRSNPRVDEAQTLQRELDCPVWSPADLTPPLTDALLDRWKAQGATETPRVALLTSARDDAAAAGRLTALLSELTGGPTSKLTVEVVDLLGSRPASTPITEFDVVAIVVTEGASRRAVRLLRDKLAEFGRAVDWAFLVPRPKLLARTGFGDSASGIDGARTQQPRQGVLASTRPESDRARVSSLSRAAAQRGPQVTPQVTSPSPPTVP